MTDARFGFALRVAARRARRSGTITQDAYARVRDVVRRPVQQSLSGPVDLLAEAQAEVLEEAFVRKLVASATEVPKEIDCEKLMELLMEFLPIILALFGL